MVPRIFPRLKNLTTILSTLTTKQDKQGVLPMKNILTQFPFNLHTQEDHNPMELYFLLLLAAGLLSLLKMAISMS